MVCEKRAGAKVKINDQYDKTLRTRNKIKDMEFYSYQILRMALLDFVTRRPQALSSDM